MTEERVRWNGDTVVNIDITDTGEHPCDYTINITPNEHHMRFEVVTVAGARDFEGTLQRDGCLEVSGGLHFCSLDRVDWFKGVAARLYELGPSFITRWNP